MNEIIAAFCPAHLVHYGSHAVETVCRFKGLNAFWEHEVELSDLICADPRILTMKSDKLISKCVYYPQFFSCSYFSLMFHTPNLFC